MSNRAVFLDRDGTLIEHYDYLTDASQVQLLPRTASALRLLKEHGYLLVLVTNQSAVARGMLTEQTLFDIHSRLKELLAEKGVYLDQIYYCPFHPEGVVEKYRRESDMRKPAPGMLKLAAKEMDIDLSQSWMVGDDDRDIQAGERAGCKTIQIDSHTTSSFVHRGESKPDYRAVNLQEAVNLILRFSDQREHRELSAHRFYDPESEGKKRKQTAGNKAELDESRTTNQEKSAPVVSEREMPVEESTSTARAAESAKVMIDTPEAIPAPDAKKFETVLKELRPEVEKIAEVLPEPPAAHRLAQVSEAVAKESKSKSTVKSSPSRVATVKPVIKEAPQEPLETEAAPTEPEESDPDEREEQAKTIRDTEIARRKEKKKLIEKSIKLRDPLENAPEEEVEESPDDTRQLLVQILRELKTFNRQQHFTEFSISKLLAGVTQMLVILCLILSFWFASGANPRPDAARNCLLVALTLQVLTLTLLMMHKS
jgi:D-glycero-D-manno-heptose 1,7-bisphosphate phosphatase